MAFTGKLGTSDSKLGNIKLGVANQAQDQMLTANEAGVGLETASASGDLNHIARETALGLEAFAITATDSRSDSGSGDDAGTPGPQGSDTGSGTESTTGIIITATEIAVGIETLAISGSETLDRPATDTGQGFDFAVTDAVFQEAFDSGSGNEQLFAPALVVEVATGTDFISERFFTEKESGVSTDTLAISGSETLDRPATDTGSSTETAAVSATITVQDAGVDPPDQFSTVSLSLTDEGSGQDVANLTAFWTVAETGTGSEFAFLSAADQLAFESSQGSEVGTIATSGADSGSGSEDTDVEITECPNLGEFLVGPEIRLPQWVSAVTSVDSKLYRLLQFVPLEGFDLDNQIRRAFLRRWLSLAEVGENRCEWSTTFPYRGNEELKVTATAGSITRVIRRAISRYDYDKASDPIWWADPISKRVTLKNLMVTDVSLNDVSGVYTISEELVPDYGIFWRRGNQQKWRWLDPEDPSVSGSAFTLPTTGLKCFRYGSQDLLEDFDSGTITIEWKDGSSVSLSLTRKEPDNIFDGYGSLLGIERLDDEDNLAYKRRMLATIIAPPDATQSGVVRGIAAKLGNLNSIRWNGVSALTLDASGTERITDVKIPSIPRFREITEQITSVSGSVYYATYSGWRPGYLVLIDGIPQPNISVVDNKITFPAPVTGTVVAVYSVEQYSTTTDSSGYIRTVVPGTGLASGSHTVLYSQAVRVHSVDLDNFQKTSLLTPEGLPNRLFIELTNQLNADSQTIFGRARWGTHATWFEQSEDKPSSARLVIPFDQHET